MTRSYVDESWHTYEFVMSHMNMCRVKLVGYTNVQVKRHLSAHADTAASYAHQVFKKMECGGYD